MSHIRGLLCVVAMMAADGSLYSMRAAETNSPAERLLHSSRPLVIAHRGYCQIAPENTLPSFRLAMTAGADLVELDYCHSKDGKLVVWGEASANGKTKDLAAQFKKLGWDSVLVIDGPEVNAKFAQAARNIPNVDVLPQQGANVYDILRRDTLVLTKGAMEHLVERLK